MSRIATFALKSVMAFVMIAAAAFAGGTVALKAHGPVGYDSAAIEAAAQSEAACNAVAERLGVYVTLPPWQAMVLTPVLDPR